MSYRIDLSRLRQNVIDYIHDPKSRDALAEQENSFLFNLIGTLCLIPIGLLMICTIYFARDGWYLVYGGFMGIVTGAVFADPVKGLQQKANDIQVVVASPVMIGPEGMGLILFSETEQSATQPMYLAKKAKLLFRFYSGTRIPQTAEDRSLVKLMKDDTYVPNRRRYVPTSHADGNASC